jgi:hypothetical protein
LTACATTLQAQAHFNDANNLITSLLADPANINIYDGDGSLTDQIDWVKLQGTPQKAVSVCGTFMTMLLKHTYGFTNAQFTAKTGSTSPNAAKYHDAIVAQSGFTRIASVDHAAPGDVISIKYPLGGNTSGHVMMVQSVGPWQPRANSTQNFLAYGAEPAVAGYYNVTVIDSSSSYHGSNDTRKNKPGGIGRNGVVRIYVDGAFQITGYTWSEYNTSEYKTTAAGYSVAIGRLVNGAW